MPLNVLYLTNQLPWPPQSGGQLRELQILSRLDSGCVIHFMAVTEHLARDLANLSAMPLKFASVQLEPALPHAAPASEPHRVRQYYNPAFRRNVERVILREQIDVIHVEGFFLMQHVPPTDIPIFLMTESVEQFLEIELGTDPDVAAKAETDALRRAAGIGAVSAADAAFIAGIVPNPNVAVVANGSDHLVSPGQAAPMAADIESLKPYVLYVANFSWFPSLDGAAHLLETLWPGIRERLPEVKLVLAGTMDDPTVKTMARQAPGVVVTGFVDDLRPIYERAEIVLCPCRIGGGTKMKMLEALSLGKPVVALGPCLEGLSPDIASAVRACESDSDFVDSTVSLMKDQTARSSLSRLALAAAQGLPTWEDSAAGLLAAWSKLADPAVLCAVSACPPGRGRRTRRAVA